MDGKQSTRSDIASVPAGSKLLRSEKKGDGSFLCIFGVYRTAVQFLDEARKLWHPYDTMAQMPDYLIRCIFEQLTLSPLQLSKLRIERLKLWKSWSEEQRPRDRELKAALHPRVRQVLEGKNLALMERLMETMDWPDKDCLTEMMKGFRLVGRAEATGLFRPGLSLGSIEEDELMAMAPALKASILDRIAAEDPGEHAQELLDISREEASVKGWLRGPHTPSEIDRLLDTSDWIPVRRFAVVQNSRTRPIDDLRENHVNEAFSAAEKVTLQAMDHVLWSLNVLVHFFRKSGTVEFVLSTGETLCGEVHKDWRSRGAALEMTALDLKSAYKQLALSPLDYDKTVVSIKNPSDNSIECYLMNVLPFGASASVLHFLRVSTFIHAVGCTLGSCWACYFDDYPLISHSLTKASSLASTKALLHLLGFDFGLEKLKPFGVTAEMLGVLVDLTKTAEGIIQVRNKPSRIDQLKPMLDEALSTGTIVPASLPSFPGKLQYADAQLFGRAGRLALADLRKLGHLSRAPASLDASCLAALEILKERLLFGKPRTLSASWREPPFLLFTDGALEQSASLGCEASIGAVLFPPAHALPQVFGCAVPDPVLAHWRAAGSHHVIGIVELYAIVVALRHWRRLLRGRRAIVFVDNWSALDVMVRGNGDVATWRELLLTLENPEENVISCLWIARVPSKSNMSDGPSRACLDELLSFQPEIVSPTCPLSKLQLRSFF